MLTCRQVTDLVTDYLEGRQSFAERLRFHIHLGMCRHCRTYLRQMKLTVDALEGVGGTAIPPEMDQEVFDRLRSWKG